MAKLCKDSVLMFTPVRVTVWRGATAVTGVVDLGADVSCELRVEVNTVSLPDGIFGAPVTYNWNVSTLAGDVPVEFSGAGDTVRLQPFHPKTRALVALTVTTAYDTVTTSFEFFRA